MILSSVRIGVMFMEIVHEIIKNEINACDSYFDRNIEFFHWHELFEICQVKSGTCSFLIDGIVYEASVGDVVVINERVVHNFIISSDKANIRLIQFPLKMFLNSGTTLKRIKPHIKVDEINKIDGLIEKLDNLFSMIKSESPIEDIDNNPFVQSITAAFYFLLMKYFTDETNDPSTRKERRDFFSIVQYINDHISENITIQSIAKELYFSRGKTSVVFEKYSGMTINEYINVRRIKKVNHMLNEDLSVTEAAFECGFQNMRTFNNIYKKIMGITPSEYIKKKNLSDN